MTPDQTLEQELLDLLGQSPNNPRLHALLEQFYEQQADLDQVRAIFNFARSIHQWQLTQTAHDPTSNSMSRRPPQIPVSSKL